LLFSAVSRYSWAIMTIVPTSAANTDTRLYTIVKLAQRRQGVTRSELAEVLGVTPSTVARLVSDLVDRGLVSTDESLPSAGRRGRPSSVIRVAPGAGYVVALEFGRRHLVGVVVDATGALVHHHVDDAPPAFVAGDETIEALSSALERVASAAGVPWDSVSAVGLALHDVVNAAGEWITNERIDDPPFPVRRQLELRLGLPVMVEDVSRAFAESEHRFGAGRRARDMMYLFLGNHGVGSGIFVNGSLLRSASGVCGEVGHVMVEEGGQYCYCGSRGCLETVASPHAVVEAFRRHIDHGVRSAVHDLDDLSFARVCQLAGAGEKVAGIVIHHLAHHLATGLASVINVTGTSTIIVGGQLTAAGDAFLTDLAGALRRRVISLLAKDLEIRFAILPGHAGALGVAVQALDAAWRDGFVVDRVPPSNAAQSRVALATS